MYLSYIITFCIVYLITRTILEKVQEHKERICWRKQWEISQETWEVIQNNLPSKYPLDKILNIKKGA